MTDRIPKINQLIKKELGQIILRELEVPKDILVTITRVETTPNLNESKIYISVLPESFQNQTLSMLKEKVWELQQFLNKRLRMRPIPKIMFFGEKETIKAGRVEEILEKLKKGKK